MVRLQAATHEAGARGGGPSAGRHHAGSRGGGSSAGRHSPCGVIHQDAFTLHARLVLASVTVTPAVQHGNRTTRTTREILWPHIARSAPDEDHHRAVAAAIRTPPSDWKRPPRRPDHTWLRAIESDLRPLNIGPSYA